MIFFNWAKLHKQWEVEVKFAAKSHVAPKLTRYHQPNTPPSLC